MHDFPISVSVIMPCHNGEKFLVEAIESVRAQSFTDWELLIINDGSSDTSQSIIDHYTELDSRIHGYRHNAAQGAGPTRNTGLSNAKGRYAAFLDCDDLWKPDKLSLQLAAMLDSEVVLSTTHYDVIDDQGRKVGVVTPRDQFFTFKRLLKCNDIGCSAAIIDRAQVGDMRFPSYQRAQDFIFWCEILRKGHVCLCLPQNLGSYRVHAKSRTSNKFQTALNRIRLLREALGVPLIAMPYYIFFYFFHGIIKQIRSQNAVHSTNSQDVL